MFSPSNAICDKWPNFQIREFCTQMCRQRQTRYATNAQIFKYANSVRKYVDNVKLAENWANRRLTNCRTPFNEASKLTSSLPQELLKELIVRPLVYIDKDMVCFLFSCTLVCEPRVPVIWHVPVDSTQSLGLKFARIFLGQHFLRGLKRLKFRNFCKKFKKRGL